MRVLLVDDERELVSALAERLSMRGFDVEFAVTGKQAVESLKKRPFDLAVLDVKMPGLSGLELMHKLRSINPDTRYIFLTGHGSEKDFKQCMEAGICSYIMKPVKIETLITKIREALEKAQR